MDPHLLPGTAQQGLPPALSLGVSVPCILASPANKLSGATGKLLVSRKSREQVVNLWRGYGGTLSAYPVPCAAGRAGASRARSSPASAPHPELPGHPAFPVCVDPGLSCVPQRACLEGRVVIKRIASGGLLSLHYLHHHRPHECSPPMPSLQMRKPRLDLLNWLYMMTQLLVKWQSNQRWSQPEGIVTPTSTPTSHW